MTGWDLLLSPILWFLVMVLGGGLLYMWATRVAPPFKAVGLKAKAFTGGEDEPGRAYRPGYQFFHAALFFTLLHVGAIMIATAPPGVVPWAAMVYLSVIGTCVLALRWS